MGESIKKWSQDDMFQMPSSWLQQKELQIRAFSTAHSTTHSTGHSKPSRSRPTSQPNTQQSSFLCPEISRVRGTQKKAATGSSSSKAEASSSTTRATSSAIEKEQEMWDLVFTQTQSERQVISPGRPSERVISSGAALKDALLTNIDLGFKPPGLR